MTDPLPPGLADMRRDYRLASLRRVDLAPTPVAQFRRWFAEAVSAAVPEANAFVLATLGLDGLPNSRTLLMKDFGEEGVTFFTNYESRKGRELAANPVASMTFLWKELERQVHVRGRVTRTSRAESETYFRLRPYESRIGAWASTQSATIPDRGWLDRRAAEFAAQYPDTGENDCVPLPDFWGGYRLEAETVEFWQGQPGRKHDRLLYRRDDAGNWSVARLSP